MASVRRLGSRIVRALAPQIPPLNAAISALDEYRRDRPALLEQLKSVGEENAALRADNNRLNRERETFNNRLEHKRQAYDSRLNHERGMYDAQTRVWKYATNRYMWQMRALLTEHFGPPNSCPIPPKDIPPELLSGFSMNGRAEIVYNYLNSTYPDNYPLIYADREIDYYINIISENLKRPESERIEHWFIYGTLDQWVCDAIAKYPIRGQSVVNMGSLTPWYESMFIFFGVKPVTIDYNRIVLRTDRMGVMTIDEWEGERPVFDVGFSISSFEHDGLGMYGDPLDPDGDLKAMSKMTERIKPGGLLFVAVPTGRDKVLFNNARIYGRHRLPLLMAGWEWIDSFGFSDSDLDGSGSAQPLYVLRNHGA